MRGYRRDFEKAGTRFQAVDLRTGAAGFDSVIEHMPADVTLAACYSQLKELERGGIRILTDDYSLCSHEPSDYFLKVKNLARQKGLRFFAKTEDTFGQEFVSTPFTPCLEQHQRRWDRLAQEVAEVYEEAFATKRKAAGVIL